MISILGYLILGILLPTLILPLIDGLAGLILTMLEAAKGFFTLKITECNCKLKNMQNNNNNASAHKIIGFEREEEEETEEDYEEYE